MKTKILGITATTENQVLEFATDIYRQKFRGWVWREVEIIDLAKASSVKKLQEHLESGEVDFCFSMQGVGSRLTRGDKTNVWTYYQTPFLCLHADNPTCNIYNHFCDSPYVANLYLFQSFLDIQQRYIKSNQLCGTYPYESDPMHHEQEPRFKDRPLGLVFFKSGRNPALYADQLNQIKSPMREAVWVAIDKLWQNENLVICDVLAEAFTVCNYDYKEFWAEFWGFASLVENYIRAKRAANLVDFLKFQKDAVIIGNGWDFINMDGAKAIFKQSITAEESNNIYCQSKYTFNISPYGSDIVHERVTHGLCNNSFVISDTNAWWDQNFDNVPSFHRFKWNKGLDEQILPAINDPHAAEKAESGTGWERVRDKIFGNGQQIKTIIEYAQKTRDFAQNSATHSRTA